MVNKRTLVLVQSFLLSRPANFFSVTGVSGRVAEFFARVFSRKVVFPLCLGACFFLACRLPAGAVDMAVGLKAGTTGFGGDFTIAVCRLVNLRAAVNYLSFTIEPEFDPDEDENLTIGVNLLSVPLLIDWHALGGNFRLSAGLAFNDNNLFLEAEPGDSLDFNEVDYVVDDFRLDIDFNRFSPYFGIGYGNAVGSGGRVKLALDMGFLYHGAPRARARATAANPALQEMLNRDLKLEVADLNNDISAFRFYPVLSIGLSCRF